MAAYDKTLIKDALIVDPEAETSYQGSLLLCDGRIAEIIRGKLPDRFNSIDADVIDATGLVAAPGFIDIHAHTDGDVPCGTKELLQGVTTVACGNCGISPGCAPSIARYYEMQEERGFPINQTTFVGHSFTLRDAAGVSGPYSSATDAQILRMKELAAQGLDEGACGISFGIQYAPAVTTREFRDVAEVATRRGRLVAVHTRLNFPNDWASLQETLDIAKDTGATVIVSHLSYMFADGQMDRCLSLIADYRAKGYDIQADSGMYTAWSTMAGSTCFDPDQIEANQWQYSDFLAAGGRYAGQRLTAERFAYMREHEPNVCIICFTGVEDDIYKALAFQDVMVSSDSGRSAPGQGHPQDAAVFARFLRIMVNERRQLSLVEAIRRCTLVPARVLQLSDRGRMTRGSHADIVLLDMRRIRERADFPGMGNPDLPPEGVPYVFVNGRCAVREGRRMADCNAGQVIRYTH